MSRKSPQDVDQGDRSPRLRLNTRLKEILATGILPSLSPSALTVLLFAQAHGDFTTCKVFLGAKTIAKRLRWHRGSARRGIDELLAVGILVPVKQATSRKATVYKIKLVPERIEAARAQAAAVGCRRRKGPELVAAEAEAKRRRAKEQANAEGAHGCTPRGLMGEPPGGSCVSPQGAHGCAPKHSSNVPSTRKERCGKRSRAEARSVATATKQAARLRSLRITPKALALSVKESSAEKNLSRIG